MRRSRLAIFSAFCLITIVVALFYAGAQAKLVGFQLLTDGSLLLIWLASAAGYGSVWLSWWNCPDTEKRPGQLLLSGVTVIALGLGTMSLITLGLGLAGWLNHAVALAMIAAGVALGIWSAARAKVSMAKLREWAGKPAVSTWWLLSIAPITAIGLIGAMFPPGILWRVGDPSFYDVVEYHLEVPREWYQLGRIVPLSHNVFSFFPFNVEMHYLLAMHLDGGPWAGMYLAQLMHLAFVILFVLAFFGFVLRWASKLMAVTATFLVASTPWLTQLGAVAYDEGGFLLFGALAIGWAWIGIKEDRQRRRALILAGAMAGLACGAKLTAVPEVLCFVTLAVAGFLWKQHWPRIMPAIRGGAIVAGVGLLTFSPWLLRNEIWAKNPVFPEATRLLGPGNFNAEQMARWEAAHAPRPDQQNLPARAHAVWSEILTNWQFGYVLFPLALCGAVFGIARRERRDATIFFLLLLLATAGFWTFATHLQGRFFVLGIPLAGFLVAQVQPRSAQLAVVVVALLGGLTAETRLTKDFSAIVYGESGSPFAQPMQPLLALPDLSVINANLLDGLAPDQPVVLIGDAKAFFYPIPIQQLHYRTVFDVRHGENDMFLAWTDGDLPKGARIIVDPAELKRLHSTYLHIPAVPDWVWQASPGGSSAPFVLTSRENNLRLGH